MLTSINIKIFPHYTWAPAAHGVPLTAQPSPHLGEGVYVWVTIGEQKLLWLWPISHVYSCQLQKTPPQLGMRLLLLFTESQAYLGNLNTPTKALTNKDWPTSSKQHQKGNKLWKPIYCRHSFWFWMTGILNIFKIVGIFSYSSIKTESKIVKTLSAVITQKTRELFS